MCEHPLTSLDIGCGNSSEHMRKGTIGLDLERGLCDIQGDASHLPFKNASFERVIASHVLEHLENFGLALDEIKRVLKVEGTLEIEVPNSSSFSVFKDYVFSRKARLGNTGGDRTHVCSFGEAEIQNIMRMKGLYILSISYKICSRYRKKYLESNIIKRLFYRVLFKIFPAFQNALIIVCRK